eukprot:jgi/Ulvmu1/5178/UM021_0195.1
MSALELRVARSTGSVGAAPCRVVTSGQRFTKTCAAQDVKFPDFVPRDKADKITSPEARDMLMSYQRCQVDVAGLPALRTAFVGPRLSSQTSQEFNRAHHQPIMLLHGFDSNALEFRNIYPYLSQETDTYAIDLIGSGFTDMSFYSDDEDLPLGPDQIREQLYQFWKAKIGQPVVIMGASLGGTVALDFAATYPEAVSAVVLVAAQGYIDGIGPASKVPRFLTSWGVKFLGSYPLRRSATGLGFVDKQKFSTEDAVRIGRLHTYDVGWEAAKLAFISSGGYKSISKQARKLDKPALLLWGREDEILDPKYFDMFMEDLENVTGHLLDGCGHFMVIEKPQECADLILDFVRTSESAASDSSPAASA